MSSDSLMDRARRFFDRKDLKGTSDPELQMFMDKVQRQIKAARTDKDFRASMVRTLGVLERDMRARQDRLQQQLVTKLQASGKKMSSEEMAAAIARGIPRELRYIQATGLSLVETISKNGQLSEKELRKFSDRMEVFTESVDKLRTEGAKGSEWAQDRGAGSEGLSLTERLRQHREGQLLDGTRHKQLLDKLDETAEKGREQNERSGDLTKLGLTALLGPAAPLFQLWSEFKADGKKLLEENRGLFETTKAKFKWDREREDAETKTERRHTSLFERMLKAIRQQELGRKASGLKGWLFGDDEEGSGRGGRWLRRARTMGRRAGRVLGRTVRGAGRVLGRGARSVGSGVASAARGAWSLGGKTLGGIAAGGASGIAGSAAMLAGAGYAGWKAGEWINDNLLTEAQKEAIGKAIFDTVRGTQQAIDTVTGKLVGAGEVISSWANTAENKLKDFWTAIREGSGVVRTTIVQTVQQAKVAVTQAAKTADTVTGGAIRKGMDFFRGESQGLGVGRYNEQEQASITAARAQGEKFRGGSGLTADTKAMIMEVAKAQGVNPEHMLAMAQMESGGNPNAVSSTGAAGLFQFTGGTGRQMNVTNRFDPRQNTEGAARLMKANAEALKKAGIEPTLDNLYLAHQQGAGGAVQIINASMGKGELSDVVRRNMGLNYGDKSPEQYLAENSRKIGAAQITALGKTFEGRYPAAVDALGNPLNATNPTLRFGSSTAGAGQGSTAFASMDPRRLDRPANVRIAGANPVAPAEYSRVQPASTTQIVQQAQAQQTPPTSTGSTGRMSMEKSDFYVDDLGLVLMNRNILGGA